MIKSVFVLWSGEPTLMVDNIYSQSSCEETLKEMKLKTKTLDGLCFEVNKRDISR